MHKKAQVISVWVPGPIISKQRPRQGKHGFYTPSPTQKYEAIIGGNTTLSLLENKLKIFEGPVALYLHVYIAPPKSWSQKKKNAAYEGKILPSSCRKDLDNIIKIVLDGMNKIAYKDDRQVCDICSLMRYHEQEHLYIQVWSQYERLLEDGDTSFFQSYQ